MMNTTKSRVKTGQFLGGSVFILLGLALLILMFFQSVKPFQGNLSVTLSLVGPLVCFIAGGGLVFLKPIRPKALRPRYLRKVK